jgi:hypothetical protein
MRAVHFPLLLLALAPCANASAQPASMPGYVVADRSPQQVLTAPPGWVGRKTIDSERRVSNTDETRGTEATYTLTFGGFVRACPTADGVVDGTFEYSLTSEVRTVPGQTLHSRSSRQLVAQLRGEVGADARLIKIELFGSWSIETRAPGIPPSLQTQAVRQTFRPGSSGEPDWHSMESAVRATADLSVAAVIVWAGEFYRAAETNWNKLNECVEFAFDPPSDVRSLAPNESAPVRVELHTKAGALPVPWETSSVQAISGGTVSPRPARAPAGAATLTYTASSQPRRGYGFELATTSRAGNAEGRWRITDNDGRWSGTITHVETEVEASSSGGPDSGGYSTQSTTIHTVEIEITGTSTNESSPSGSVATLTGRARAKYNRQETGTGWARRSCGSINLGRLNNSTRTSSEGTSESDTTVTVTLTASGSYNVISHFDGVTVPITGSTNTEFEVYVSYCKIENQSKSLPHVPSEVSFGSAFGASGTIDPANPNQLQGSKKSEADTSSDGVRRKKITTTTWNLRRN